MAQGWWQWLRGWWNIGSLGGFSRLYDTISNIREHVWLTCVAVTLQKMLPDRIYQKQTYHRDRTRQEIALRACSARANCFLRQLPKYQPSSATTRPHTGTAHGRSGTSGAIAAAAQPPQTTTGAALPQ